MGVTASQESAEAPAIPETMRRLVLVAPGKTVRDCELKVEQVPVPKPKLGQVLIKVFAAPINPSDYGSWVRSRPDQCPKCLGNEGSGRIVAIGGGLSTKLLRVGQGVGFTGLKDGQGSYSEYVVADALTSVFKLPDELPVHEAASFFVNPYTAVGILNTVREEKSTAFVHTAAASQLGQMMVKLAKEDGDVKIINVVRREEQANLLREIGAEHVVVTQNNQEWKKELKGLVKELDAKVAFDAIGGQMSADLLEVMPNKKGVVYVYGGLAGGTIDGVDVMDLIYKAKRLKGWLLTRWIMDNGGLGGVGTVMRVRSATARVVAGLAGGWSSSQFQDCHALEDAHKQFADMLDKGVTGCKLRIRFDDASASNVTMT